MLHSLLIALIALLVLTPTASAIPPDPEELGGLGTGAGVTFAGFGIGDYFFTENFLNRASLELGFCTSDTATSAGSICRVAGATLNRGAIENPDCASGEICMPVAYWPMSVGEGARVLGFGTATGINFPGFGDLYGSRNQGGWPVAPGAMRLCHHTDDEGKQIVWGVPHDQPDFDETSFKRHFNSNFGYSVSPGFGQAAGEISFSIEDDAGSGASGLGFGLVFAGRNSRYFTSAGLVDEAAQNGFIFYHKIGDAGDGKVRFACADGYCVHEEDWSAVTTPISVGEGQLHRIGWRIPEVLSGSNGDPFSVDVVFDGEIVHTFVVATGSHWGAFSRGWTWGAWVHADVAPFTGLDASTCDPVSDTIAAPGHPFDDGHGPIRISGVSGANCPGLEACESNDCWIIRVTDDTIAFADSRAEAKDDVRRNITSAATGTLELNGGTDDCLNIWNVTTAQRWPAGVVRNP